MMEWKLTNKVASVTVDNASYNDVAIKKLKDVFSNQRKLPFDGMFFHTRCCAHIVNILVQEALKQIEGIIHDVRETVKHIDKSSHRMKLFGEVVKSWHLSGKKLILDCPTSWNSTFQMLSCALDLKDVFGDYEEKDPSYTNKPLEEDWIKVEKICLFLQIFNDITETISGTEYPTSNLFLIELAQIKEELEEKSKSDDDYIRRMAESMKEKFDKYWANNNILISVGAVLDPRYKMKVIQCFANTFHKSDIEAEKYVSEVKDTLNKLYEEYLELYAHRYSENIEDGNQIGDNFSSSATKAAGKGVTGGRRKFDEYISGFYASENSKSELSIYLEAGVYIPENTTDYFDPLEWWKSNSLKFRTLSNLARDILAIPITSVASESTCSAGIRVIDSYRASLGADTVQMLLCGGDWLRNFYNIKKKRKNNEQETKELLFL